MASSNSINDEKVVIFPSDTFENLGKYETLAGYTTFLLLPVTYLMVCHFLSFLLLNSFIGYQLRTHQNGFIYFQKSEGDESDTLVGSPQTAINDVHSAPTIKQPSENCANRTKTVPTRLPDVEPTRKLVVSSVKSLNPNLQENCDSNVEEKPRL